MRTPSSTATASTATGIRACFSPKIDPFRTSLSGTRRPAPLKWKWNASVGTDGDTVLGSAAIHDESRFRKEVFVERDIVETPEGVERGSYYTFAGAALDLPVDDSNVVTLVAGVQPFTGDNVRTHVRATYVHVVKPD